MHTVTKRLVALVLVAFGFVGSFIAAPVKAVAAGNNNQIAWTYFTTKGMSKAQTAGIIGNLVVESGASPINPRAVQWGGGPGRGVAQWTVNQRWQAVLAFAKKQNRDPWSLDLQLDFIWSEFMGPEKNAYNHVKAATTIDAAAIAFSHYFEKCGVCDDARRISEAKKIYNYYVGTPTPPAPKPAPETAFPVLSSGSKGAAVTTLQYLLRAKGKNIAADGVFGPGTLAALKSYQSANGLVADGVAGANTWAKLPPRLASGSTGDAVRALQLELRAEGYSLAVDGVFGPGTKAAVLAYQKKAGLAADGIVGPATWGSLVD